MNRCNHVLALEEFLRTNKMDVYSEHGEEPDGWVNVVCPCTVSEIRLLEEESPACATANHDYCDRCGYMCHN